MQWASDSVGSYFDENSLMLNFIKDYLKVEEDC